MITAVTENRLLVVSDVHLGNRLFRARRSFLQFLRYARSRGFGLCINGDGVDIVQTTLQQITRDMSECTGELRKFAHDGLPVYYTVGNHDIVLEHFLDDWEIIRLAPFLNLSTGGLRVRIEHGHLYDDAYVTFPGLYVAATWLGGMALRASPSLYHALESGRGGFEKFGRLFRPSPMANSAASDEAIPNEPAMYCKRAQEISRHGFDCVIFGHTHCAGEVRLPSGATYMNTGSWLFDPHFAEIDHGKVVLRRVAECGLDAHDLEG